ncbi:hypothetical protein, partial [Pseudorhodoplanes sp.]|uniref:hypothetical protein n=1 Tax=Pseudorhodoplanes sp. TaxID=1934341 RepID=UPI002C0C0013
TFSADVAGDCDELMCRRHWRMADTLLRDRHKRIRKRIRKLIRLASHKAIRAKGDDRIDRVWQRLRRAEQAAWQSIKEDVTIKAALDAEAAPKRRPRHDMEPSLG